MKRFPKELQQEAGVMKLDETRLQLVLKKSSKMEYVKENLADTGFILEGISEEGEGFKFDLFWSLFIEPIKEYIIFLTLKNILKRSMNT